MKPASKVLAVVTARKGSKRLRNKNLKPLLSKPLLHWTLKAGVESSTITTCLLSTDCEEMRTLGQSMGAQVPFLRPAHLASDTAKSIDVVLHSLDYFESQGEQFDYVILLQPTSPLRTSKHIDEAFFQMIGSGSEGIISVCEVEHSPIWSGQLGQDKDMSQFLNMDFVNARSQDLPPYFRLNGAIYIAKVAAIREQKSFFLGQNLQAYIMSQRESIDIDSELDFKFAQLLMEEAR
ncbi:CMP-N-acetlyneuraminic acid synthetase [Pseudoalteromonas sp. MSK9-3]|uniref:acylneuraminate cytidylyltransferase family protein n=1 Tax=Pseudoalteromonas sp. MSK9-3 TaxID=1897633 RepID=UPI000E6BFD89|nr:acylneuraminate cytidylyltransferase family protein [Pseudoalteromonas sp. MSK9-3]RJE77347.1 CMP-N-acetlyneuraminic acid synthetase [Pseudoalteromonas sp. MSK9-3]